MDADKKMPVLKYEKLNADAGTIIRNYNSAGYDLQSAVTCIIPPHEQKLICTGIRLQLPEKCYGRLTERSGHAYNHKLQVCAGTIDNDYHGPIKVLMFNRGSSAYHVVKGERIAQLILEEYIIAEIQETKITANSERNDKGFGSTGK